MDMMGLHVFPSKLYTFQPNPLTYRFDAGGLAIYENPLYIACEISPV
jgi:hypothetical protein